MFYFDKINGREILKSDFLSDVEHFFTTRESVIRSSETHLRDRIDDNIKVIKEYLGVTELVSPQQTHSANVEDVKKGACLYPETDGLILKNREQAIYLNFADCTPVIECKKLLLFLMLVGEVLLKGSFRILLKRCNQIRRIL